MFISAVPLEATALIGLLSSKAIEPGLSSSIMVTIVLVSPPTNGTAEVIGTELTSDGSYN